MRPLTAKASAGIAAKMNPGHTIADSLSDRVVESGDGTSWTTTVPETKLAMSRSPVARPRPLAISPPPESAAAAQLPKPVIFPRVLDYEKRRYYAD